MHHRICLAAAAFAVAAVSGCGHAAATPPPGQGAPVASGPSASVTARAKGGPPRVERLPDHGAAVVPLPPRAAVLPSAEQPVKNSVIAYEKAFSDGLSKPSDAAIDSAMEASATASALSDFRAMRSDMVRDNLHAVGHFAPHPEVLSASPRSARAADCSAAGQRRIVHADGRPAENPDNGVVMTVYTLVAEGNRWKVSDVALGLGGRCPSWR